MTPLEYPEMEPDIITLTPETPTRTVADNEGRLRDLIERLMGEVAYLKGTPNWYDVLNKTLSELLPRSAGASYPLTDDLYLGAGAQLDFQDEFGEKERYYSNTYLRGVLSGALYDVTTRYWRVYDDGDTPGTTTPRMEVDTLLNVLSINGNAVWHAGNDTALLDKTNVKIAKVGATANVTISNGGLTYDGITLTTDERVFLGNQTNAAENGLYLAKPSGTALVRAPEADTAAKFKPGTLITITEGPTYGNRLFLHSTDGAVTLGTTNLSFTDLTGGSGGASAATTTVNGTVRMRTAPDNAAIPLVVAPNDDDFLKHLQTPDAFMDLASRLNTAPSTSATLSTAIAAQSAYIGGKRYTSAAIGSQAFTASRDTYVDLGTDGVIDLNAVVNNAAAPALAANHVRLYRVITSAGAITRVDRLSRPDVNVVGLFSAYRSANTAIAAGVTKLPFDSTLVDVEGWFDTATNTYTPRVPGWYVFKWIFVGTFAGAYFQQADLYRKNVFERQGNLAYNPAAFTNSSSVGHAMVFANGIDDSFQLYSVQGYASTMIAGSTRCQFMGYRLPYS